jgi:hypothetical protein
MVSVHAVGIGTSSDNRNLWRRMKTFNTRPSKMLAEGNYTEKYAKHKASMQTEFEETEYLGIKDDSTEANEITPDDSSRRFP